MSNAQHKRVAHSWCSLAGEVGGPHGHIQVSCHGHYIALDPYILGFGILGLEGLGSDGELIRGRDPQDPVAPGGCQWPSALQWFCLSLGPWLLSHCLDTDSQELSLTSSHPSYSGLAGPHLPFPGGSASHSTLPSQPPLGRTSFPRTE